MTRPGSASYLAVQQESASLPGFPVHVADPHPTELGGTNTGEVGELAHHVVTSSDHRLPGLVQRFPPAAEEFAHGTVRRKYAKSVVAAMPRTVERVDRRLERDTEAAGDLAGVSLFQEREVVVDQGHLAAHRRPAAFAHLGEILVDLTRGQLPRPQSVMPGRSR